MTLNRMKRQSVPLHAEVAAMLRNQIMSGELGPGSPLPPLSELTEIMGVARMTIRQAMNALEDEGLIERYPGRGTFVKQVELPKRQTLNMKAELSQLQSMVAQLEVAVLDDDAEGEQREIDGVNYQCMKRVHVLEGKPFCQVDLKLDDAVYQMAPERFAGEIVVSVLNDLGISVDSARQRVKIAYADFEIAQALEVKVNSPVFHVFREFFDPEGQLLYSASLIYPGEMLEFDIEFTVDGTK